MNLTHFAAFSLKAKKKQPKIANFLAKKGPFQL